MDTLTLNVYNYGCTGIFEKHKLLFSFQMTLKMEMDEERVKEEELDFFIKVSLSTFKYEIYSPLKFYTNLLALFILVFSFFRVHSLFCLVLGERVVGEIETAEALQMDSGRGLARSCAPIRVSSGSFRQLTGGHHSKRIILAFGTTSYHTHNGYFF